MPDDTERPKVTLDQLIRIMQRDQAIAADGPPDEADSEWLDEYLVPLETRRLLTELKSRPIYASPEAQELHRFMQQTAEQQLRFYRVPPGLSGIARAYCIANKMLVPKQMTREALSVVFPEMTRDDLNTAIHEHAMAFAGQVNRMIVSTASSDGHLFNRVYTLEIDNKPLLCFKAFNPDEQIASYDFLRELEAVSISKDNTPVWDGEAELHCRPATEEETALYDDTATAWAGQDDNSCTWVMLVPWWDGEEWEPPGTVWG